jgi:ABC-type nitrate/sulfonate/bicarbonate transport system substrate-binding protein
MRVINYTTFGTRRIVVQALEEGFFERRGLHLEVCTTQNSEQQMQELLDRRWDVGTSDADNFLYWTEDHMADFVVFMVGEGSPNNQFWVTRDIQSFEDLRGQTIAVDSAFSGQSTTVRAILQRNGLLADRDYTFLPVGSSPLRAGAIAHGRAVGASLNQAAAESEDGRSVGLHILADASDYIQSLPAGPFATTRRFAAEHPDVLLDFIGALIDVQAWLLDPSNRDAAIGSIVRTDRVSEAQAAQLYQQAVADIGDLSVASQVRTDMIQVQLNLRAEVGLMVSPTPPLSKFVTTDRYARALALRGVVGK